MGENGIVTPREDTEEELRKLHRLCLTALRDYIHQANATCSLLQAMDQFPISMHGWLSAVNQRNGENDAYERYRIVREQLFKALRPGSTQGG